MGCYVLPRAGGGWGLLFGCPWFWFSVSESLLRSPQGSSSSSDEWKVSKACSKHSTWGRILLISVGLIAHQCMGVFHGGGGGATFGIFLVFGQLYFWVRDRWRFGVSFQKALEQGFSDRYGSLGGGGGGG